MTNCARRPVYDAPMEVIYLDRLFAVNALIDYLLCLLTGRICGLVLKRPRYLGAALLGAAYAVAAVLPRLALLASGPGKLVCASLMAALAFGGEAKPLRCGAVFLGVSAAFGGAVWALSLAGSRPSLDLRVLALSFALCYGGATLLFRGQAQLPSLPRAELRLCLEGKESRFMALRDTGNRLCDPYSGAPVLLASPHALAPLFPGADLTRDALTLLREPSLAGRFRLISYSSVGGDGLLPVFRPDLVEADGTALRDQLVAVSPAACGEGFEAIF